MLSRVVLSVAESLVSSVVKVLIVLSRVVLSVAESLVSSVVKVLKGTQCAQQGGIICSRVISFISCKGTQRYSVCSAGWYYL